MALDQETPSNKKASALDTLELLNDQLGMIQGSMKTKGFRADFFFWDPDIENSSNFSWKVKLPTRIIHRESGAFFEIKQTTIGQFSGKYSPGSTTLVAEYSIESVRKLIDYITSWLKLLNTQLNIPAPPWGTSLGDDFFSDFSYLEDDDSPFTPKEVKEHEAKIDAFEARLLDEAPNNPEVQSKIKTVTNRMKKALPKLTKAEWLYFVGGLLMSLITALSLSPDVSLELKLMVQQATFSLIPLEQPQQTEPADKDSDK